LLVGITAGSLLAVVLIVVIAWRGRNDQATPASESEQSAVQATPVSAPPAGKSADTLALARHENPQKASPLFDDSDWNEAAEAEEVSSPGGQEKASTLSGGPKESESERTIRAITEALAKPAKPAPFRVPATAVLKRRRNLTEEELHRQLSWMPEIKSLTVPTLGNLVQSYYDAFRVAGTMELGPGTLLQIRGDLAYLPVRVANRLPPREALILHNLSRELRLLLDLTAPNDSAGRRALPRVLEQILRDRKIRGRPEWLRPEAIPVLLQLLMHEDHAVRRMLVDLLADISGPDADAALARRAVVDLAPDVREAALHALRERPRDEARTVFLQALRYPWSPVADHAAEALAYLQDEDAVPRLVGLLRRPDPAKPITGQDGKPFMRELVRIAHSANCLLCHPPALTGGDLVRREVPGVVLRVTDEKAEVMNASQLPARLQGLAHQTVESRPTGYGQGGGVSLGPLYVRADITFLRQDFSISELTAEPGVAGLQKPRFDFMVRVRPAREDELQKRSADSGQYEQRDAVLWALRELTGKDPGPAAADWLALYPMAEFDVDSTKMANQLVAAHGTAKDPLLARLRDGKGAVYTQALLAAIPHLGPKAREKARATLAERLIRMTARTLADKLRDEDPELRRAAALACASKGSTANVPDLEALLDDPSPAVAKAAREALRQLKGQIPVTDAQPKASGPVRASAP
jgi:HEAT repeat protein